jgi:thiosulfate dehydrogenase [quinone] large subunit
VPEKPLPVAHQLLPHLALVSYGGWTKMMMPAWVALPLRLFLGVTFVYAGIQKLTDPQYFRPSAPGYIGRQIAGMAHDTPLGGLLTHLVVPHATFFGGLIAWGELAIGLGVLIGLLVRPAAFFGTLLSLIFFLSASWRVSPYFYGSDIVFLFGWSVMVLAGPVAGGWPVLDSRLASWLLAHVPEESRDVASQLVWVALGVPKAPPTTDEETIVAADSRRRSQTASRSVQVRGGRWAVYARAQSRRDFFRGATVGVASALGLVFVVSLLRGGGGSANAGTSGSLSGSGFSGATTSSGNTSAAGRTVTIAELSQVPTNSGASFTVPASGDPGVLVHLSNGNFVAFDAVCTHAGCTVQYDPSSQLLLCPCHGAGFDPAHGAAVVQGPAPTPLINVPITVNQATGAITVSG